MSPPTEQALRTDRQMPAARQEVNRPCFVCGGEQSEVAFAPDVRRWGQMDAFVLRRCSGCGLVFNSPRLPPERLGDLYRRNYYFFSRPAGAEFGRIRAAYARTIAHLPDVPPGTLLEVGSAKGYMLALLAGLQWRVTGVEIADAASRFSRRHFAVEVFTGTLEQFRRADDRRFDVLLAQDLLEHVAEPGLFLKLAYDCLRPGGYLVIDTPNVGGANVAIVGERWRGFNPFHIYLFDRHTLTRSLANAGFTVRTLGSYNAGSPEGSVVAQAPARTGAAAALARLRAAVRQRVDQTLVRHYLRRATEAARRATPLPLDALCRGDNLVCIAVRPPEHRAS
jgi:2-polyprenyl-3-methyl-5-hydroxy-6-metoxy-1,4-benzoquinol methylase